jgi:Mrp family chromosome partitioning ATPase
MENQKFIAGLTVGIALAGAAYMVSKVDLEEVRKSFSRNAPIVPIDANEDCPGTGSEKAGKSSACDGCPNQAKCASGEAAAPDPAVAEVAKKLKDVEHKILVLSGKGGVGKSTVSAQLTFGLAQGGQGADVGLLDVDICGPSIPRMMGIANQEVHSTAEGWSPVFVNEHISVMSVGFLLPDPDSAVIWRGPKKHALIKQFLTDVNWGNLDYLVVDTPPGTSDEHMSIVGLLKDAGVDGGVLVTTPQEVSLQDVRKEISFCRKVGIRIIGVIENMSGFICPSCSTCTDIFTPSTGGAKKMCEDLDIPYLGSLPLTGTVAQAGDKGAPLVTSMPQLAKIVDAIRHELEN